MATSDFEKVDGLILPRPTLEVHQLVLKSARKHFLRLVPRQDLNHELPARIIHGRTLTRRASEGVVAVRPRLRVGLVCGALLLNEDAVNHPG